MTRFWKEKEAKGAPQTDAMLGPLRLVVDQIWTALATQDFATGYPASILVAGAGHGVGTTTVAACTASGLSRHLQIPTVLFELGVGAVRADHLFGLPRGPTAEDVVSKHSTLEQALRRVGDTPLYVLASFNSERRCGAALPSMAAVELLRALTERYRIVVIDSPPLLESAVARSVLPHANKVVLVLRANSSRLALAEQAVELIRKSRVELAGTVLNRFKKEAPWWLMPSKWQ